MHLCPLGYDLVCNEQCWNKCAEETQDPEHYEDCIAHCQQEKNCMSMYKYHFLPKDCENKMCERETF